MEQGLLNHLIEKFDLAKEQIISYENTQEEDKVCFKDIFASLEEPITEKELANLLGINNETFRKFCKGSKNARILSNIEVSQEEKQEILENIISEFDLQKGELISKEEFFRIYDKVKSKFTQYELGELLGVTKTNINNIRNNGTSTPILKNRKYYKDDKTVLLEIIEDYNLYREQQIYYNSEDLSFLQIYERYKSYFTEMEFALILGGTRDTFYKMKIDKLPFKILKNIPLLEDMKQKFKGEIKQIVYENEGRKIDYKKFKQIHMKYKTCITEKELAMLLGIDENMLSKMKKERNTPVIKDYSVYKKCYILKRNMENRWYALDEIEKICKENEIEVSKFVRYIMRFRIRKLQKDLYLEALYKNNGLWIGHKKMSDEFINQNYEEIRKIAFKITRALVKKYNYKYMQDELIDSGIEYIIMNCGDIEENLKYDMDKLKGLIYTRTRKRLNGLIVKEYNENLKQTSTDKDFEKSYERKKRIQFLERYRVKTKKLENEVIDKIMDEQENESEKTMNDEEKIIYLFKKFLLEGYDEEIAIDNLSNIFKMDKNEMLDKLKKHLLETGKVVENKKGEYQIGEK